MDNKEYLEIDLLRLVKALWHRAWAVVLAIFLCGVAGFTWSAYLATPLYKAETLLYVNNSSFSVGSTSFSISSSELTAAQSLVNTYLVILKTRMTLDEVIREAELDYTYEELSDMISAGAINSTEVFEIAVTSDDPEEAERIANTIAEVLPDKISDIVDGSSVRIVDYAIVPSQWDSPNVMQFTAVGMVLGFAISCAVIIILKLCDRIIRTEDYLMQNYELPVLACIPELSPEKKTGGYGYYSHGYYTRQKSQSGKEGANP